MAGASQCPEFRALSRAKKDLVLQLCSTSFVLLKDECRSTDPPLLTLEEDQSTFGARGITPAAELSTLLDIVLTRVRGNPLFYGLFRNLDILQEPSNKQLASHLDNLLEEERRKVASSTLSGAEQPVVPVRRTLDDQPTLAELKSLKLPDGSQVTIIKSLAPYWYDFGIGFDFDAIGDQLDQIRAEFIVHGPIRCCTEMFKCWLSGKGRCPRSVSWNTLLELMADHGQKRLRGQVLVALQTM